MPGNQRGGEAKRAPGRVQSNRPPSIRDRRLAPRPPSPCRRNAGNSDSIPCPARTDLTGDVAVESQAASQVIGEETVFGRDSLAEVDGLTERLERLGSLTLSGEGFADPAMNRGQGVEAGAVIRVGRRDCLRLIACLGEGFQARVDLVVVDDSWPSSEAEAASIPRNSVTAGFWATIRSMISTDST